MSGTSYKNIDISNSQVHLGDVHNQGQSRDQQILQQLLESLRYDGMEDRRNMLAEAERGTFEWALRGVDKIKDEPDEWREEVGESEDEFSGSEMGDEWEPVDHRRQRTIPTLRIWLEGTDETCFCCTGKPGSGKSTFMRFLSTHPDVEEAAQRWLQGKRLLRAEHFFWIPGSALQKSYNGLIRNLLYQCLLGLSESGCETGSELVKLACQPKRSSFRPNHAWNTRDLEGMLSRLLLSLKDIKCLLLIDGLDECEPQDRLEELTEKVMWISHFPNVKLCVSCRPWTIITHNLVPCTTLHIDTLTYVDMIIYIKRRFSRVHKRPIAHSDFHTKAHQYAEFIKTLAFSAQGVFLWLELVTNGLISEIRKGSSLETLSHVLKYDRIPKARSNVQDTASALKLAMSIQNDGASTASLFLFWLLRNGHLVEGMSWRDIEARTYSQLESEQMAETTKDFLEETCRDLLIIMPSNRRNRLNLLSSVGFLHRSVFDFLNKGAIRLEIDNASPKHFETNAFTTELRKMKSLHVLGHTFVGCSDHDNVHKNLEDVFARWDSGQDRELDEQFLSACDSMAATRISDGCLCQGPSHYIVGRFLEIALRTGCTKYVLALLKMWPHIANHATIFFGRFLVQSILSDLLRNLNGTFVWESNIDVLKAVLACGAEPNEEAMDDTPYPCTGSIWARWLARSNRMLTASDLSSEHLHQWQRQIAEIVSLMIQHGADPTCQPCIIDHEQYGPSDTDRKEDQECHRVSFQEILRALIPTEYLASLQTLQRDYSCRVAHLSARRRQRLRAVRAFLHSEHRYNAIHGLAGSRKHLASGYDYLFVRDFQGNLSDNKLCSECHRRISRGLSDNGFLAWCADCGKTASLCGECMDQSTSDIMVESALASLSRDCTFAFPGSPPAIVRGYVFDHYDPTGIDRVLTALKEWYHKNPLPEEEMYKYHQDVNREKPNCKRRHYDPTKLAVVLVQKSKWAVSERSLVLQFDSSRHQPSLDLHAWIPFCLEMMSNGGTEDTDCISDEPDRLSFRVATFNVAHACYPGSYAIPQKGFKMPNELDETAHSRMARTVNSIIFFPEDCGSGERELSSPSLGCGRAFHR
ncbi:hypothetical protein Q7P37_000510 [Cladosporium fusiforme]